MKNFKLQFVSLLALVILTSCEKKSVFLPSTELDKFDSFVDPPRTNILLLSNNDLYFIKDDPTTPLKLVTISGDKKEVSLSPNADFAVYQDIFGNCYKNATVKGAKSQIVNRLNGASHIHWTKEGLLYGVFTNNDKAFIRFESASMPYTIPVFPIDFEKGQSLNDAVITSDSNIVFSKHTVFSDSDSNQFSSDNIITWNKDSASFNVMDSPNYIGLSFAFLQIDKEDNILSYSSKDLNALDLSVHILQIGKGELLVAPEQFQEKRRHLISKQNHINNAFIHNNKQLVIVNNLRFNGYPNSAKDDTISFTGINFIQDFDIQVPLDEAPPQEPPF